MSATRLIRAALLVTAVAAMLVSGCAPDQTAGVTSAWPQADSERTIPRPAELVRWPLTGLPAGDADTSIRAVSVKIENSAASRPQSSLHLADIVYESLTEGSITRFNAIFHSNAPESVGPCRSARQSDVYIVPQYEALFAHVGGNSQVISNIRNADIADLDEFANTSAYWRTSDRPRPHNMYTSIVKLRELGVSRGYDTARDIPAFAFEFLPEDLPTTVSELTIPIAPGNSVRWEYDEESDSYLRFLGTSTVHSDAVSGEQYAAKNVVVMWAAHNALAKRDVVGSSTLDIRLNGNGRASLFRNGQRYDGTWETDGSRPPRFVDDDGEIIRLSPGSTWIQVVKTSVNIAME